MFARTCIGISLGDINFEFSEFATWVFTRLVCCEDGEKTGDANVNVRERGVVGDNGGVSVVGKVVLIVLECLVLKVLLDFINHRDIYSTS